MTEYIPLISAGSALAGSLIGGLISFLTTYFLKKKEWQHEVLWREIEKREELYTKYMSESTRLILLAVDSHFDKALEFAKTGELLGRIRMQSSIEVIEAAENLMDRSLKAFSKKKPDSDEDKETTNLFSNACRKELNDLKKKG